MLEHILARPVGNGKPAAGSIAGLDTSAGGAPDSLTRAIQMYVLTRVGAALGGEIRAWLRLNGASEAQIDALDPDEIFLFGIEMMAAAGVPINVRRQLLSVRFNASTGLLAKVRSAIQGLAGAFQGATPDREAAVVRRAEAIIGRFNPAHGRVGRQLDRLARGLDSIVRRQLKPPGDNDRLHRRPLCRARRPRRGHRGAATTHGPPDGAEGNADPDPPPRPLFAGPPFPRRAVAVPLRLSPQTQARAARAVVELALDRAGWRPWSAPLSFWLDALIVIGEGGR